MSHFSSQGRWSESHLRHTHSHILYHRFTSGLLGIRVALFIAPLLRGEQQRPESPLIRNPRHPSVKTIQAGAWAELGEPPSRRPITARSSSLLCLLIHHGFLLALFSLINLCRRRALTNSWSQSLQQVEFGRQVPRPSSQITQAPT